MAEQTNSTIEYRPTGVTGTRPQYPSNQKPYTVPYSTVQYSNTIPLSRVPQTNPPPPPLTKAPRESAKKKKVTWRENANGALPLHRPATSARSIVRGSRGSRREEGKTGQSSPAKEFTVQNQTPQSREGRAHWPRKQTSHPATRHWV